MKLEICFVIYIFCDARFVYVASTVMNLAALIVSNVSINSIPRIGIVGVKVLALNTKKITSLELQLNAHSNTQYDYIYIYYIACIHGYPLEVAIVVSFCPDLVV